MKKNGFTLAEVLITLAIIGVVATMTLPALMTNTAEQQYKTGLRKGINTLTEVAQMNQAIDGFDYASITSEDTADQTQQSLYAIMAKRAAMDFGRSGTNKLVQNGSLVEGNYVVFFRDGSALSFLPSNTLVSASANGAGEGGTVGSIQEDGLVYGIAALYDTNGVKGPNLLSNCSGNASTATEDSTTTDAATQCTTANRVLKDQFGVRLRGGYAVPNGAAARWVMEN